MTTYYVGPTAAGAADGSSWADRYGSLNDAEDTPVIAGDLVYVGPGVYREQLTCDVSGGAGTEIVYVGDMAGENTDGVGGLVRITGSNNDQVGARWNIIQANAMDYRIFRGFCLDTSLGKLIEGTDCDNWTVEDSVFQNGSNSFLVHCDAGGTDWTVRRCAFLPSRQTSLAFYAGAAIDNCGHVVENCMFLCPGQWTAAIEIREYGDGVIRNCILSGATFAAVDVAWSPNPGRPWIVNNCILIGNNTALTAAALGDLVENFNTFYGNSTDRTNVNVGANSQTYPPLLLSPILHPGASQISGFKFPWWFGELSEWSQIRAITGSSEPSVDLRGIARPATAAKNSWGPLQFHDMERDTATVRTGPSSLTLNDAGRVQFTFPVTARPTIISVYVQREVNYAGTNPRMIVKQPGQADRTTTDTGAAGAWNLLRDVFTPAAEPPYVMVELASLNTAAAGNYAAYFDDLRGRVA